MSNERTNIVMMSASMPTWNSLFFVFVFNRLNIKYRFIDFKNGNYSKPKKMVFEIKNFKTMWWCNETICKSHCRMNCVTFFFQVSQFDIWSYFVMILRLSCLCGFFLCALCTCLFVCRNPSIKKANKMNKTTTNQPIQCINQMLYNLSHTHIGCFLW